MKKTLLILSCCGLLACEYDNEEELFPESAECETTNITYDNTIGPLMNTNCAVSGCHDGNSGLTGYTNYAAVKVIVDNGKLEQRVLVQKDMPPSVPLTSCELAQFQAWIDNGAPEN
jgi:hypothetical protein